MHALRMTKAHPCFTLRNVSLGILPGSADLRSDCPFEERVSDKHLEENI